MNINSIAGNQFATEATTATKAKNQVGADQEVFLKLLVAQMKNQDPLEPQDSTQYMTQLAQFSSLEQLTGINSKLGELLDLSKK
jgi:flagellar basal-body rod modification protein FlgD